jgi:hypothetical protein
MPGLRLRDQSVHTVFDLLSTKENDITFAVGWALSRSDRMVETLLGDILGPGGGGPRLGWVQHFGPDDGGFTDIEIETERKRLIVEAKRGWNLPSDDQLGRYAPWLEDLGPMPVGIGMDPKRRTLSAHWWLTTWRCHVAFVSPCG